MQWDEKQTRLSVASDSRDRVEDLLSLLERSLRKHVLPARDAPALTAYARSFSLPPLALTYRDVAALLGQVERLLPPGPLVRPTLVISGGSSKLSMSGRVAEGALSSAPPRSTSLEYRFSQDEKADVSTVEITLTDSERRIEVKGTDAAKVNALAALILDSLNEHTTLLGGRGVRFVLGSVALCISLFLIVLSGAYVHGHLRKAMVACVGVLIWLVVLFGSWDQWMPGVGIYGKDASWVVRGSPLMGFIGFILAIVGTLAGAFRWIRGSIEDRPQATSSSAAISTENVRREPVATGGQAEQIADPGPEPQETSGEDEQSPSQDDQSANTDPSP